MDHTNSTSTATTSSTPEKPPMPTSDQLDLPIDLHHRKISISIHWSIILLAICIFPEVLYFGLVYSLDEEASDALAPPTAILAALSVLAIAFRTYKLCKKDSVLRPAGAKRWMMDYFNINTIVGFIIVTAVLASATAEDPPNIRQASMPQAVVLYFAGLQVTLTAVMHHFRIPTPVQFSSHPRGGLTPPGILVLMEDVCAVDGGGGLAFRETLLKRYNASPRFQTLIRRLNWFWGTGALGCAIATTVVVFAVENLDIVYGLGWSLPVVWAMLWTSITIVWASASLRRERLSRISAVEGSC